MRFHASPGNLISLWRGEWLSKKSAHLTHVKGPGTAPSGSKRSKEREGAQRAPGSGRSTDVRARVHALLDGPPEDDPWAFGVQISLALVVVLNTVAVVVYTVPSIAHDHWALLNALITVCLVVFTAEYFVRLWACTDAPTFPRRMVDRLRFAASFYLIIDLISIVPLFFPIFFPSDHALLKAFRLLSIFKLGRYARKSRSLALLRRVVFRKREIFTLMVFFLVFVILFSSTIMYLVEHEAQPGKFSSIPAAIWWSMMTVTTVGYGDIYPVTPLGQAIASLFTLMGVLLLALPSAILASGFIEERHRQKENNPETALIQEIELMERASRLYSDGVISREELDDYRRVIHRLSGKKKE